MDSDALGEAQNSCREGHPRYGTIGSSPGAEVINFEEVDVREALIEMTGGSGPDACIDDVGMESHGFSANSDLDKVKAAVKLVTDQTPGLRQMIVAGRKGGRISIPGVCGGVTDKFPIGALMEKGLSVKSGQTHVQKYMPALLKLITEGKLNTTFLISHRLPLEQAPRRLQDGQREAERSHQGGAQAAPHDPALAHACMSREPGYSRLPMD
jgi:threonine dehydrogenase-like Zn-dependent dehydrogenase